MTKKYLITGGFGFIGNQLTKALVKAGYQVRVLDNSSRGDHKRLLGLPENLEIVRGDIRDPKTVKNACRGMDGVIHLAAVNGTKFFYTMPEVVLDVATRGIINVIDASLWHGVEEIYLASSSEVYHVPENVPTPENTRMIIPDAYNPRYSYAGGKIISELLLLNFGKKYFKKAIIFRPHNVYGPDMGWEHVIPQFIIRLKRLVDKTRSHPVKEHLILTGARKRKFLKFPIQGDGSETRSFIFIDDFVRAFMIVLKNGRHLETYNIGSNQEIAIKEVANLVASYFKTHIKISPGKLATGGTIRRSPDITKIKKLGFEPKINFESGLFLTASWYNDNIHKFPASEII